MKTILVKQKRIISFVLAFFVVLALGFSIIGISASAEPLDPNVWKERNGVTYRIVYDLSTLSEAQPVYYDGKYYQDVALVHYQKFGGWNKVNNLLYLPILNDIIGVVLFPNKVVQGDINKDLLIQEHNESIQTYCFTVTYDDYSKVNMMCHTNDDTTVDMLRSRYFRVDSATFPIMNNDESSEPVKIDFTTNFGAKSNMPGSVTAPIDCTYIFDNNVDAQMQIDYQTNFDGYVTFYIVRESTANKPVNIANCFNGLYRNMQLDSSTGGVLLKYKQRLVNSAEFPGLVGDVGSILYKDKTLSDNYSKWYDPIPCIAGTPYTLTYPASALSVNAGQKCALLVVCHPKDQKQFPTQFLQDLNDHFVTLCEYDGITKGGFYGFTMKNTVIANYDKAPYLPVDDNRIFSDDGSKIIDDKGGTGSDGRVIPPNSTTGGSNFYNVTSGAFDFIRGFLDVFPAEIQLLIITGLSVALAIGILRLVTG